MHATAFDLPGFRIQLGKHRAGDELPRHSHTEPTLCFLMDGRFTEYSRNQSIDCVSGTMKLMPAGEVHANRFVAPESHGVRIDIAPARFAESAMIRAMLDEHRVVTSDGPGMLMRRLVAELRTRDDASRMVVEGLLLELLGVLSRDGLRREIGIPRWLRRADEVVHADYASNISLSRVAGMVGVAPATLARSYRAAFMVSVGERVRQLRLEQAARELTSTHDTIAMIAAGAGFYDQSHFTSAFRQRFGVTPARYRLLANAEPK